MDLARFAPPSVGGGLKPPGGEHRRTPVSEDLGPTLMQKIAAELRRRRKKNGQLELQAGIAQLWLQVRNQFLHFSRQEAPNLEKMAPERSKIDPRGPQNPARSPPRRHF